MKRLFQFLALVAFASVMVAAIPIQQSSATFEGRVIDSVTGQPIPGAHVTISSNLYGPPEAARQTSPPQQTQAQARTSVRRIETPAQETPTQGAAPAPAAPAPPPLPSITVRSVFADAQGKFTIADVPPGTYCIGTAAEGYVYQIYGQKVPYGGLTPVKLSAGTGAANTLVIRLDPASEVSGMIINEAREPVSRSTVYLLRTVSSLNDGTSLYVDGEAQTDDTGKFSLKGVAAGSYRLIAGIATPLGRTPQPTDLYAWTFYPGVTDRALAAKIDVLPGARSDLGVLALEKQNPRAIRGHIVDSRTGRPPAAARLGLTRRYPFDRAGRSSEELYRSNGTYEPTTGAFEFSGLPGGRYRVDVSLGDGSRIQPAVGPAQANPAPRAFSVVDVGTTDLNGVAITVPDATTLRAKIVVAGEGPLAAFDTSTPARPQFRLLTTQQLQPASSLSFVTSGDEVIEEHSPLAGKYRVQLGPLKGNYYISELRLDGVRVPNHILDIQPNAVTDLVMTLRRDGGQVEGTIVDEKNQPVAGVRGIALPDPAPDIVGRYYSVYSNPDGHFTVRGIEPGNYRIYVWEGLGELQLFDRELWQRTRLSATPVHIDAGSQITINVKRITP